jgi:hypothetical protein
MNKASRRPTAGGYPAPGRPGLVPANPLPVSRALLQVLVLLGIPLLLLVAGKVLVRAWWPEFGY